LLPVDVTKSAMKFNQRFAILPYRNGGAELSVAMEVFLEKRFESFVKLLWSELHPAQSRNPFSWVEKPAMSATRPLGEECIS
jgi:hypothetical protein